MFDRKRQRTEKVSYDEILLEASNLPAFNTLRMEGRVEKPIRHRSIIAIGAICVLAAAVLLIRLIDLQIARGQEFATLSTENSLITVPLLAERGVIYDRHGEMLAWNEYDAAAAGDIPARAYSNHRGLGHVTGYVTYPRRDVLGVFYRDEYEGKAGVEKTFNTRLSGENGTLLVEETARGEIVSSGTVTVPRPGNALTLSIDAELSEGLYEILASSTTRLGFRGGAAAIMQVDTGEMLALVSVPGYDPETLADGTDSTSITDLFTSDALPLLNRAFGGAYIPGSIVKPFVAYAALAEGVISPEKEIVSTGSLIIPNPYHPDKPSIFRDWRAHGATDMRRAIAYSSDVYFYQIGGGYEDQEGLGIKRINEYMERFEVAEPSGINLPGEVAGTIPTPEWKRQVFDDDWRLGDTYFTAIGQYGFLATPIAMLRAYAALAGGMLLVPQIELGATPQGVDLQLDAEHLRVVQEGMRAAVIEDGGTARALERSDVAIAAKSGTAELDATNTHLNSWIAGYFPYEAPRFAFILLMEQGPYANTTGAGTVMGTVFDWIAENRPEYLTAGR